MESVVRQIRFLAEHGMKHKVKEQVGALIKIVELISADNNNTQLPHSNDKINNILQVLKQDDERLLHDQQFCNELQELLVSLSDIDTIDPLIAALKGFFSQVVMVPMIEILSQSEEVFAEQTSLSHYLEADLAGKLAILWKILVREGVSLAPLSPLSDQEIVAKVTAKRDPVVEHFYPKTIDLVEIILSAQVYRFSIFNNDKHRYRLTHEQVWVNGMRLVNPNIPVEILKSDISAMGDRFYIDLQLAIDKRRYEWFYSIDNLLDESIFDDLSRLVAERYGGGYLIENYGQSGHFALAYLPNSVLEKIRAFV